MEYSRYLYVRSPRLVQSLLLNLHGFRVVRRRNRALASLQPRPSFETWTRLEQIEHVEQQLRAILCHAVQTVPRYWQFAPILPQVREPTTDVFALLEKLPVVTREEVRSDPASFLSSRRHEYDVVKTHTSGTTGTPFETWIDREAWFLCDTLPWRRNLWAGYKKGDWIARLVGDPVVPLSQSSPKKPWRISWTDRRIYFSTYHLDARTASIYLSVLERRRPAFLMGYPSSLAILAEFALEMGREMTWQPKAILYSSEPLYQHQCEVIGSVFGAPMRGFYGSAERLVSASECECKGNHLSLIDGYLEGQFGILPTSEPAIITTLVNRVMPLVRFQSDDVIRPLPDEACACGRTLPLIEPVITKKEDWVETPSGRRISSSILTWAFKDLCGIRRSQIRQVRANAIEVHVDADHSSFDSLQKELHDRLNELLFAEMEIHVLRNPSIELTTAGKSRFVVREPGIVS